MGIARHDCSRTGFDVSFAKFYLLVRLRDFLVCRPNKTYFAEAFADAVRSYAADHFSIDDGLERRSACRRIIFCFRTALSFQTNKICFSDFNYAGFLFYGYAVRLNAAAAVLPLAVWTGIIICELFSTETFVKRKNIYAGLIGLVYFSVLTLGVYLVNEKLTEGKTVYPSQQIFLYDLAAISIDRNEPLFPEYILREANFSLENVKTGYNLRSVNSLIYGDHPKQGDPPLLKLTQNPEEITELKNKWYETVCDNKLSYLQHRYFVFAQLNGFTRQTVSNPYWDRD